MDSKNTSKWKGTLIIMQRNKMNCEHHQIETFLKILAYFCLKFRLGLPVEFQFWKIFSSFF